MGSGWNKFSKDERGVGKPPQVRGVLEDLSGQVLPKVDNLSHEMAHMRDQAKQVEAMRGELGPQWGWGHGSPGPRATTGVVVGAGQTAAPLTGPVQPLGVGLGHGRGPIGEGAGRVSGGPGAESRTALPKLWPVQSLG